MIPTMIATPAPSQTKRKKTINDVAHELDPMDRLLEHLAMRAEGQDVCADDVFIVHWTHVPKAGGTAFAGMAKKISCARNPAIASSNPCCVRDVVRGGRFLSFHRVHVSAGAGHWETHVEHG